MSIVSTTHVPSRQNTVPWGNEGRTRLPPTPGLDKNAGSGLRDDADVTRPPRTRPRSSPRHAPRPGPPRTSPSRWAMRLMAVLSPPGRTRPSQPSRSAGRRTSTARTPSERRMLRCSRNAPWIASTPTTTDSSRSAALSTSASAAARMGREEIIRPICGAVGNAGQEEARRVNPRRTPAACLCARDCARVSPGDRMQARFRLASNPSAPARSRFAALPEGRSLRSAPVVLPRLCSLLDADATRLPPIARPR